MSLFIAPWLMSSSSSSLLVHISLSLSFHCFLSELGLSKAIFYFPLSYRATLAIAQWKTHLSSQRNWEKGSPHVQRVLEGYGFSSLAAPLWRQPQLCRTTWQYGRLKFWKHSIFWPEEPRKGASENWKVWEKSWREKSWKR